MEFTNNGTIHTKTEFDTICDLIDITEDLIYANRDFICSDCINTIHKLINILNAMQWDTSELEEKFNNTIQNWY